MISENENEPYTFRFTDASGQPLRSENNLQNQRSLVFLRNSISDHELLLKTTKFAPQNGKCRGSYDFDSVFDDFGDSLIVNL